MVDAIIPLSVSLDGIVKDADALIDWYLAADEAIMASSDFIVGWGDCYKVGDFTYVAPDDFDAVLPSEDLRSLYVCIANLVEARSMISFADVAGVVREDGITGLMDILEPIASECRDAVYFTEMYPDCYCDDDLEEWAGRRPDLFSLEYCNIYPELQYAAVSAGVVDLFAIEDPTMDALSAWYARKDEELAGSIRCMPACWGGNMSVGPGWVTEDRWDDVFPGEVEASVFRIYSTFYSDREREELKSHLHDNEWLARADEAALRDDVCDCFYTEIWPDEFTREELDELYSDRPDLFTAADVACYEELSSYEPVNPGAALAVLEGRARAAVPQRVADVTMIEDQRGDGAL